MSWIFIILLAVAVVDVSCDSGIDVPIILEDSMACENAREKVHTCWMFPDEEMCKEMNKPTYKDGQCVQNIVQLARDNCKESKKYVNEVYHLVKIVATSDRVICLEGLRKELEETNCWSEDWFNLLATMLTNSTSLQEGCRIVLNQLIDTSPSNCKSVVKKYAEAMAYEYQCSLTTTTTTTPIPTTTTTTTEMPSTTESTTMEIPSTTESTTTTLMTTKQLPKILTASTMQVENSTMTDVASTIVKESFTEKTASPKQIYLTSNGCKVLANFLMPILVFLYFVI